VNNDFIHDTADVPFDHEPLPPTASADYDKRGSAQPALSWPDTCAAVARAFLAASRGGPPTLMAASALAMLSATVPPALM
jgi:hypothetical protein